MDIKGSFKKNKFIWALFLGFAVFLAVFFYFDDFFYSQILYAKFLWKTFKTPVDIKQVEFVSSVEGEEIEVSLVAFRVDSPYSLRTYRDEENIINIVENASNILNQASVELKVVKVISVGFEDKLMKEEYFIEYFPEIIKNLPDYNENQFNLVFLKRNPDTDFLQVGGKAYVEDKIVLVIDRYYDLDYQILAHEIGHLFGLKHPNDDAFMRGDSKFLMGGGFLLKKEEIEKIHKKASLMIEE